MFRINEVFHTLQGEGYHQGQAAIFVRFAGCNLQCDLEPGEVSPGGFQCDTEFAGSRDMSLEQLVDLVVEVAQPQPQPTWCVLTGGEPTLQIDDSLVRALQATGFLVAVETNGTRPVPDLVDWITLSPKVAEHALQQVFVNEVKYVRGYGQALPKPRARPRGADPLLKYLSPASIGPTIDPRALRWCVNLVLQNPTWRLTTQAHKAWGIP